MPTNLPPEYYEVDKRYRAAQTPEEKAELLEELIATVPKHKGTDKLRADMRERLSRLKAAAQARKKTGRSASAYNIGKEGAGQVVVLGAPNSGKSSLLVALTNANPEVSIAPYTTWTPMPGMMRIENIQVQLIDTPPLDPEYIEPEMVNLIRRADMLLLMVDIQADVLEQYEQALEILAKYQVYPAGAAPISAESRRVVAKPWLVLVNKCDDEFAQQDFDAFCELLGATSRCLPLSVLRQLGFEEMKQAVYAALGIIRVYSQKPGKAPDFNAPFVMKQGGTVEQFATSIHKDFARNLKSARVWGSSVFDGQPVSREYVLHEGDVIELKM